MRKDHEDQIQHLKRLKNDELDVVKSATSQTRYSFSLLGLIQSCTNKGNPVFFFFYLIFKHIDGSVLPPRSLTVVTEQMEQFSSHLGELCSFSVMQDRLAEQQKAAVEERAFLKDIISRMHTQLREQERQLEKVRTELLLALAWCFRVTPQHGGKHTNLFLCFRNAGRQQQKRPRWSRSKEAWRKSGAPSAKRERSWKELR